MLHESLMLMILAQDAAPISTQEMVAIWDKGRSEHQVQESLDRMLQRGHIVFFGLAAQYLRYWDLVSTSLQYLQCMIEIDTIRYTTHNYDIHWFTMIPWVYIIKETLRKFCNWKIFEFKGFERYSNGF